MMQPRGYCFVVYEKNEQTQHHWQNKFNLWEEKMREQWEEVPTLGLLLLDFFITWKEYIDLI